MSKKRDSVKIVPSAENDPMTESQQKTAMMLKEKLGAKLLTVTPRLVLMFIRGYESEKEPHEATLKALEAAITWRTEYKAADYLYKDLPQRHAVLECYPSGVHGFGKEGHLVYVDRITHIEPAVLAKKFGGPKEEFNVWTEVVKQCHVKQMEELGRYKDIQTIKTGKTFYKHIVIVDLSKFAAKHMGGNFTNAIKAISHIDSNFYPESLHKMFICNAPWLFRMMWKILSPLLHATTKARISMNADTILQHIDAENVPAGILPKIGKCKCKDANCVGAGVPFVGGDGKGMDIDLQEDQWKHLDPFDVKAKNGGNITWLRENVFAPLIKEFPEEAAAAAARAKSACGSAAAAEPVKADAAVDGAAEVVATLDLSAEDEKEEEKAEAE